jgi:pimeloyl-ACP methyl ester carboxylesterase
VEIAEGIGRMRRVRIARHDRCGRMAHQLATASVGIGAARTHSIRFFALVAIAGAATACGGPVGEPKFALAECEIAGAKEKARCGMLEVPENWDKPNGRKISLNIVVVPAIEPTGLSPLFDLAGGPGVAATVGADYFLTDGSANRAKRDVVLVDQRGTGGSAPLRCPELENASPLTRMYPLELVRACRKTLAESHDLSQYTTLASVRDLDAVRQAIGANTIDLFGLSYGAKLAQAYIRAHPDRVRSAMMMGVPPTDLKAPLHHARNAEKTLRRIFADCAADAACAAAYPALEAKWSAVGDLFGAVPVTMSTPDGEIAVERGPFMEAFRSLLGSESGQRRVPRLIYAAAAGDFKPFVDAAANGPRGFIAEGLYLSIECAEGAPLIDPDEIEAATARSFLGRYRVDEQLAACKEWGTPAAPAAFAEPVVSATPVFLLAGGRDHVTPREFAERVARGFSNHRLIVVEEMAHNADAISSIACIDRMAQDFDADADPAAIDASCTVEMKAPPFDLGESAR